MIQVENLGKTYRLGVRTREDTLVGSLKYTLTYPIRNYRELRRRKDFSGGAEDDSVLWALRDLITPLGRARYWASSATTERARARC